MKLQLTTSILVLCSAVAAQGTVVSPGPAYMRSEGASTATSFGAFAAGRYQIIDANHRGSAMSVSELAMRQDHRNYDVTTGMGRSWSNMTLHLAECDYVTATTTFSTNAATTPSKVFDGSVNWPIQLDVPVELPADWSLTIPFSSSYSYSGTQDLLTDFVFSGGVLANHASWSGAIGHAYALDSFGIGDTALGQMSRYGHINGGCFDSSSPSRIGASLDLRVAAYSPNHSNPALQNKYFIEATGFHFAPSAAVMMVLTFKANPTGFAFPGVSCNHVHLGLNRTWFMHPMTSNAVGNIPPYHFGAAGGLTGYSPLWHGINLFVQSVFTDSTNSALLISSGARNAFPTLPPASAAAVRMKTFYDSNPANAVATRSGVGESSSTPILRYKN